MEKKVIAVNIGSNAGIEKNRAYTLDRVVEDKVTNFLGYKPIEHFDDTDVGLVRHLGSMECRAIYNLTEASSKKIYDLSIENGAVLTDSAVKIVRGENPVAIYSNGRVVFS